MSETNRTALQLLTKILNAIPARYATPDDKNPIYPGQPGYDEAEYEMQFIWTGREKP